MKFHNQDFELKHIQFLYNEARFLQSMRNQWKSPEYLDRALEYQNKLEEIVALMENIVVFNVGDGLYNFKGRKQCLGVDDRLDSFKILCEKV